MELLIKIVLALVVLAVVVCAFAYLVFWLVRRFTENQPNEHDVEFAAAYDALQEERARAEAVQRRESDHQVARAKFGGPLRDGHEL